MLKLLNDKAIIYRRLIRIISLFVIGYYGRLKFIIPCLINPGTQKAGHELAAAKKILQWKKS